ncbi:hypothetical protein FQN57_002813 [Myotisia sp. PD_48]|nr:hypothetical protein FQN57_002813 [Myotisia sp. PD_48]
MLPHNGDNSFSSCHLDEERCETIDTSAHQSNIQKRPNGELARDLEARHMHMIAIGGGIGSGLFVGSGKALSAGGPGCLLLGFILMGIMALCTTHSLGELAVTYPVNGAFYVYFSRFIDPAWQALGGFAMGWQYTISWLLTLPFEISVASLTIRYWNDEINVGVWITIFLSAIAIIQIFGVRGYGEAEFVLTSIKIVACIGLIILGVVINVGGVPTDDRGYIGGRYWRDPGAFHNGLAGFATVIQVAGFAYGGAEIVGLTAAEARDPAKSIPSAVRQVLTRILIFYILNMLLLGLNLPSDDPRLLGAGGHTTKASPFTIAIQMAGIKVLPSVINAIILITVLSVANTSIYASTRTLQALAQSGHAPKIFEYIDSKGRPIWCIVLQLVVGLLAFVNEAASGEKVFTWFLAVCSLGGVFIWGSICLAHIRFKYAWKLQHKNPQEILWRSPFGISGSVVGILIIASAVVANFYLGIKVRKSHKPHPYSIPTDNVVGTAPESGPIGVDRNPITVVTTFLSPTFFLSLFFGFKIIKKNFNFGVSLHNVDLNKGRREFAEFGTNDTEPRHTSNRKIPEEVAILNPANGS